MKNALLIIALAGVSVAAQGKPAPAISFKVGTSTFSGTAKSICVIKGNWADGEVFRYEGWDECRQMRIRHASKETIRGAVAHGDMKRRTKVSDIPAGAEVFEISNNYSQVLVFKDASGAVREILSRD
jgi:hypothetical protein